MWRIVSRKAIISVGVFFGLWLVILYIDRGLIGTNYVHTINDTSTGWFGIGLNWLSGDPLLWRHHPSNTVNMLSGLVVAFLSIDGTAVPLRKFIVVGTLMEGGLIFAGAVWFAWISNILKLTLSNRLVLLFLVFCMPPAIMNPGHWGMWTDFGLLSMPLGLTLVAGFRGSIKAIRVGGIVCGVMAANFYPSGTIAAVFFLTLLWQVYPNRRFESNQSSNISKVNDSKLLIALCGICIAGWAFGVHFSGLPHSGYEVGIWWIILCALSLWGLVSIFLIPACHWDNRLKLFATWGILAFILANGFHLPWYFHGLFEAADRTSNLLVNIARLFIYVTDYPWLGVFWFCYLSLLLLVIYLQLYRQILRWTHRHTQAVVTFSLLSMSIIVIVGATELSAYPLVEEAQVRITGRSQGMATRVMMFALPALSAGCVVLFMSLRGIWLSGWKFTLILFSVYSLTMFYNAYSLEISERKQHGLPLDAVIDRFLEKEHDGRVICISEAFNSYYCTVGYAYNRYRSKKSAISFPTERLFHGRLLSLNMNDNDLFESHTSFMSGMEPYMVITDGGGYRFAMIDFFRDQNRKITPIWKWQERHIPEMKENISPGDSFFVSRVSKSN